MEKYSPPYEITNKMIDYVSKISEKLGKISEYNQFHSKPHLRRNNKIRSIHSSLSIEANSLSLDEVKNVIDGKTVIGKAKEIQEVINAYECYDRMNEVNPYDLGDLKMIHGIMTKYIVKNAGKFRYGEEGVFSGDKCIFYAPPAKFVSSLMQELFDWMEDNKNKVHPLILSAIFHYEFVFIHPFTDGNGRMARLWHTILLTRWKPIFEYIPLESQIEKFQQGYYDAISQSHSEGKSNCFIEFILRENFHILDEVYISQNKEKYVSTYVKKLLDVMEYDISYTSKKILDLLHLKSKETLRKNYLNPALEEGYIEMTIPNKPRSKDQRYKKIKD